MKIKSFVTALALSLIGTPVAADNHRKYDVAVTPAMALVCDGQWKYALAATGGDKEEVCASLFCAAMVAHAESYRSGFSINPY